MIYKFDGGLGNFITHPNISAPTSMFIFQSDVLIVDSPAFNQIILLNTSLTVSSNIYDEAAVGPAFLAPYDVIAFHGVIPGNIYSNLIVSF